MLDDDGSLVESAMHPTMLAQLCLTLLIYIFKKGLRMILLCSLLDGNAIVPMVVCMVYTSAFIQ